MTRVDDITFDKTLTLKLEVTLGCRLHANRLDKIHLAITCVDLKSSNNQRRMTVIASYEWF